MKKILAMIKSYDSWMTKTFIPNVIFFIGMATVFSLGEDPVVGIIVAILIWPFVSKVGYVREAKVITWIKKKLGK